MKASIFDFLVEDNKKTIVFNSLQGLENAFVTSKSVEEIRSFLYQPKLNTELNRMYSYFESRGILVEDNSDEKAYRDFIITKAISNSKLQLLIDVTKACNFRCKYCSLDFEDNRKMTREVQDRIIDFVRHNIAKYTSVQVDWFGGEPLLAIDVIEYLSKAFIEICKKTKKKYLATVTTNGYYLSNEILNRLVKCQVLTYTITIDGLESTHDRTRVLANGEGSYHQIIDNLVDISRNNANRYLRFIIRTNVTREIQDILTDYLLFMDEKLGNDFRFSQMFRIAYDWGGDRVEEIRNSLLREEDIIKVYRKISELNLKYTCQADIRNLEVGGMSCRSTCINRYAIDVLGNVSKCENVCSENVIGFIDEDGILQKDIKKEAIWTVGHRKNCREECDNCELSPLCFMSPCPAEYIQNRRTECLIKEKVKELLVLANRSGLIDTFEE